MRFLVTGGAGFIGSHLSEKLSEIGEVVIYDNLSSGRLENIKPLIDEGIEFFQKSILDIKSLQTASEGVDFIFHLAALPSIARSIMYPVQTNEVHVTGTLNLLEVARKNKVKKVVYASSASLYGNSSNVPKKETMKPEPLSPYAVSKLTAEHYCNAYSNIYKLPTVSLRYFNVYGPKQDPTNLYSSVIPTFITKILHKECPIINGDGSITRDFTYVEDVVRANIRAFESEITGVFNIAYGEQTSLNKLSQLIIDITGHKIEVTYGPERPGDVKYSYADISKSKELLDYEPEYNIQEGLKKTINWYKEILTNKE